MSILDQLYRLQQLDSELFAAKKRLGEILLAQKEPADIAALRSKLEADIQSRDQLRQKQKDQDLQLGSVGDKLNRSTQRLYSGEVRNPKELEDLENEVNSLTRRQSALEDEMLGTMEAFETAETTAAQSQTEFDKKSAAWVTKLAGLKEEQLAVATQMNTLIGKRQADTAKIETSSLRTYEKLLKSKRGLAVAIASYDSCEGCRVGFSGAIARKVNAGEFVNCPSCGRILMARR